MIMNEFPALLTFIMATEGAEKVNPRKRSSRLPRIIKKVLEINSSVQRKAFGCMMWSSSSAQDLRFFEMEKEKEDVSSPRGVLEACIKGFNDDSNSSDVNSSREETPRYPSSQWQKFFKMWKEGSVNRLPSLSRLSTPKASKRKSISARENPDMNMCLFNPTWKNFSLSELNAATNNFSQDNLIGKGGFAEVYKGCLYNGRLVAVKRLIKGTTEDQIVGFLSEIGTIGHVNHPNTAKLVGYGVEGGTFLVLELSSLGSLGSLLRGSRDKLDWGARYKIILGTANGLLYLHENCQRRIIHRDIKADNILLTENFEPQICDFGLAKWLPIQWTHHSISKFEGTFGYFAPEYFMHGIVDEKTDVFAYGVLVLEIVTGKRALDESQKSLVLWAKPLLNENATKELVDPILGDNYNLQELLRVLFMASWCIEETPVLRPRMNQIVMLLRGEDDYKHKDIKQHKKRDFQRTYSEELLDAEEYNSTKYLNNPSQVSSPRILRGKRRQTLEELLLID